MWPWLLRRVGRPAAGPPGPANNIGEEEKNSRVVKRNRLTTVILGCSLVVLLTILGEREAASLFRERDELSVATKGEREKTLAAIQNSPSFFLSSSPEKKTLHIPFIADVTRIESGQYIPLRLTVGPLCRPSSWRDWEMDAASSTRLHIEERAGQKSETLSCYCSTQWWRHLLPIKASLLRVNIFSTCFFPPSSCIDAPLI